MGKIYNNKKFIKFQRDLRKNQTKTEYLLWKKIRNDSLGVRFRRQYNIGKYIVDFYCPQYKIAIEVDGLTHAEESVFKKDVEKQKYLESLGIKIFRFNSIDVVENLDGIFFDLLNYAEGILRLHPNPPFHTPEQSSVWDFA